MATSIADLSSLLFENRDGYLVNKNLRQYLWPYSEQKWHGVFPSISFALISAPCWTKAWRTLKLPLRHAIWRGVLKLFVLASTWAPNLIRISINGAWPSLAARWRGVNPSEFVQLTISNNSFSWLNYIFA